MMQYFDGMDCLRRQLATMVLQPISGSLGGDPPTPGTMAWIWPEADADEGKIIVNGYTGVGAGQVSLFQKLSGTGTWTDPDLVPGSTGVRAIQWNELRQAVEFIRRGRWELPIRFFGGLSTLAPDQPWLGEMIANNGADECRTVGPAFLFYEGQGLSNVTVRPGSYIELTADIACTAEVHHCLRTIDYINWLPCWNAYSPSGSWSGGIGPGDSTPIGSVALAANVPGRLTGAAVAAAMQAMVDGAQQNFLVRKSDESWDTIRVTGRIVVEFELNAPPN
jgi:hypothetical protein